MNVNVQTKKAEAVLRMEALVNALDLDPKLNEIKEGKRYCSNHNLVKPILQPIEDDAELLNLVKQFETKRKAYVYHVILSGASLTFLYVNDFEEDWEYDWYSPEGGYISAYVYNMLIPELSETGDVFIDSVDGIIARIA